MRRAIFMKAIEKYHQKVVWILCRRGMPKILAQECFQQAVVSALDNCSYTRLPFDAVDSKVQNWLVTAAKNQRRNEFRKEVRYNDTFVSIIPERELTPDNELERTEKYKPEVEHDPTECPFCHIGILNEYKACGICNTILGQGRMLREPMTVEESDLGAGYDIPLNIDVADALATLTHIEREVMQRHAQQGETLDDLADRLDTSRASVHRIYLRAKHKLQAALIDYAA